MCGHVLVLAWQYSSVNYKGHCHNCCIFIYPVYLFVGIPMHSIA